MSQSLANFADEVPTCTVDTTLREILQRLQYSQIGGVVIVTSQDYPLGIVWQRQIMKFLAEQPGGVIDQSLAIAPATVQRLPTQRSSTQLSSTASPLLQSLPTLPERTTLQEFVTRQPRPNDSKLFALINANQQFVGLVNSQRLQEIMQSAPTEVRAASLQTTTEKVDGLFRSLSGMFPVLDGFPVPLQLKALAGEIIHQNAAWSEAFGDAVEPVQSEEMDELTSGNEKVSIAFSTPQSTTIESAHSQEWLQSYQRSPSPSHVALPNAPERQSVANNPAEPFTPLLTKISDRCTAASRIDGEWQFLELPFLLGGPETLGMPENLSLKLVVATPNPKSGANAPETRSALPDELTPAAQVGTELLLGISHDLRSPLTAILGFATLLQEQRVGDLNERQSLYVDSIAKNTQELIEQANQLLSLAQDSSVAAPTADETPAIAQLSTPLTVLFLHGNPEQTQWLTESTLPAAASWPEESLLSPGMLALHANDAGAQSYRILEADSLEQAITLARLWQLDVVVLDEIIDQPQAFLQTYSESAELSSLPLVILDANTAAMGNRFPNLSIYPYFPQSPGSSWQSLLHAIQIATHSAPSSAHES